MYCTVGAFLGESQGTGVKGNQADKADQPGAEIEASVDQGWNPPATGGYLV